MYFVRLKLFYYCEFFNLVMVDLLFIMEFLSVWFFYITFNWFIYIEIKEDFIMFVCYYCVMIFSLFLLFDEND